jgi:hypothetical protein
MAHQDPEDRFRATLRPRRELLEALWNLAYYATDRRRRKRGERKVSILNVAIWVQVSQAGLIRRYLAHAEYLRELRPLSKRTLTRQVAGFRRLRLLSIINPSHFDRRRREWVHEHNVYSITYLGKLWIKRHARAVKIPLVV